MSDIGENAMPSRNGIRTIRDSRIYSTGTTTVIEKSCGHVADTAAVMRVSLGRVSQLAVR